MSQSKSAYGAESPKGTANEQDQSQNTNAAGRESSESPEPACRSRSIGREINNREWREIPYSERILASYTPCSWPECFPDGPPDATDIGTVVGSRHHPTTFHRLHCAETANSKTATDTVATADEPTRESISDITELGGGDGVVWQGRTTPLVVVETTTDPDGVVQIDGPRGGGYQIEGRPDCPRAYYVNPGIGVVTDVCRVILPDDRPRPEVV